MFINLENDIMLKMQLSGIKLKPKEKYNVNKYEIKRHNYFKIEEEKNIIFNGKKYKKMKIIRRY